MSRQNPTPSTYQQNHINAMAEVRFREAKAELSLKLAKPLTELQYQKQIAWIEKNNPIRMNDCILITTNPKIKEMFNLINNR